MKQRKTEHPILFSGPMVRAILEGRKTQTRRTNGFHMKWLNKDPNNFRHKNFKLADKFEFWDIKNGVCQFAESPFQPGDTLWVRERFCEPNTGEYLYMADHVRGSEMGCIAAGLALEGVRWRPSIHMPRRASRIALLVEDVRVERLQDISEEDAMAEGVKITISGDFTLTTRFMNYTKKGDHASSAIASYSTLWNSLNAARGLGWDANPWVFAYKFSVKEVRK